VNRLKRLLGGSILLFLFFLAGCNETFETIVQANNAEHPTDHHRFEIGTPHVVAEPDGFFIEIMLTSKDPDYVLDEDYLFAISHISIDESGKEYEAQSSEKEHFVTDQDQDAVLIRQFFTPALESEAPSIDFTLYVQPTYYEHEVVFNKLDEHVRSVEKNDLTIRSIDIKGKKLALVVEDVHNVKGIELSLKQGQEYIYPVSSITDHHPHFNSFHAEFEFAQSLPNTLTLRMRRPHLDKIIWEFPLTATEEIINTPAK
jgi:hypothetical protein